MATKWYDFYAKCHYYKGTDSSRQITCQGVADSSDLCWKFKNKRDLLIQLKTFCCYKYEYCEVFQMLKKIYESEE